jgi:Arc/MetJ family transcription regulator
MKTLVDVDETLLKEAMTMAKAPTKKETIRLALQEFVRSYHRRSLKTMAGSGAVDMTLAELRKARRRAWNGRAPSSR